MKNKVFAILISLLFISSLNVIAGNINDPEITDNNDDTLVKHYDILSAWFHENADEPEYLYISMKVNSLNTLWMGGSYLVEWTSPSGRFASGSMLGSGIWNDSWRCGDYSKGSNIKYDDLRSCEGSIDKENNIITWKIFKNEIGNPRSGDILTKTKAVSCITGRFNILLPLRGLPGLHDNAPNDDYGLDYIIQY